MTLIFESTSLFISELVFSAGLYLCSALVRGLYLEVQQEVRVRESGTFRSELSPVGRVSLRVHVTSSQVFVWNLWKREREMTWSWIHLVFSFTLCVTKSFSLVLTVTSRQVSDL